MAALEVRFTSLGEVNEFVLSEQFNNGAVFAVRTAQKIVRSVYSVQCTCDDEMRLVSND